MTWSTVAIVAVIAVIVLVVAVLVYAFVEASRTNEHKRRMEWKLAERGDTPPSA